jgi:DivIVA domain-containing protein
MVQLLLLLTGALVVGAIVFGVAALITGGDALGDVEPDGRSVPLPGARPLLENDVTAVRFDAALRGYRMAQVDQALRRAAYDIGYKCELIQVLEAEIDALRDGRTADADALRATRLAATGAAPEATGADPEANPTVVDLSKDGDSARADETADPAVEDAGQVGSEAGDAVAAAPIGETKRARTDETEGAVSAGGI